VRLLLLLAAAALAAAGGKRVDLSRPADYQAFAKPKANLSFAHPESFETRLETSLMVDRKARSIDAIPLEALEGPAVVVDAAPWCATRKDCQVRREDLLEHERMRGRIPQGAVVMIKTGWGRYWGEPERYVPGHPGLHPAAAVWLAENRKPKLIAIDAPSIDHAPSKLFETHRALFARNIPVIENAAGLELLPQSGAFAAALPAKLKGAAYAPARLYAVVDSVR
jgi:kynurenine formamidase